MNIRERQKGVWQLTWETGRDTAGKRQRRRETLHGNKHAAEKRWREVQQQLETGWGLAQTGELTADWLRYWLREVKSHVVRQRTRDSYALIIDRYLIPTLGPIRLDQLRPDHIQAAVRHWAAQPKANGQRRDTLSPTTILHTLTLLKSALNTAVEFHRIPYNPAAAIKAPKQHKASPVWWSSADAQKFLESTQGERYWIAWALALLTGMRQGEILGLRWHDIDWDRQLARVRQIRHTHGHRYDVPKTERGRREIALDTATVAVLKAHRQRQRAERLQSRTPYEDHDLIVATRQGRPVSARNLVRDFARAIHTAEVPPLRFHDLRHTHGSLLIEGGANARVVADRLGHSQVSFTLQTYVHARVDSQRKDTEALTAQLLPRPRS